jgi:hypothetical protein
LKAVLIAFRDNRYDRLEDKMQMPTLHPGIGLYGIIYWYLVLLEYSTFTILLTFYFLDLESFGIFCTVTSVAESGNFIYPPEVWVAVLKILCDRH